MEFPKDTVFFYAVFEYDGGEYIKAGFVWSNDVLEEERSLAMRTPGRVFQSVAVNSDTLTTFARERSR